MKVSIVTINYNNVLGLRRTIESVVNQTCKDYEYIIIDGGSTDGSVDIIKQYENKITYWVSEKDRGIYNAMNKGIAVAKGDYCNFLNSGDCYFDSNVIYNFKGHCKGEDLCIGNAYFVTSGGKHVGTWYSPKEYSLKKLFKVNPNHQSAFIKLSLMRKYRYDESLKIVSDMKFFLQALIIENCSYKKLPFNIVYYDGGGISTTNIELYKREKELVYLQLFPKRIYIDSLLSKEITP